VESAVPELRGKGELVRVLFRDLQTAILIHTGTDLLTPMEGSHGLGKWTTGLGDQFLQYISEPEST
jgi:hypothetical protein